jgi:hypothetical protein
MAQSSKNVNATSIDHKSTEKVGKIERELIRILDTAKVPSDYALKNKFIVYKPNKITGPMILENCGDHYENVDIDYVYAYLDGIVRDNPYFENVTGSNLSSAVTRWVKNCVKIEESPKHSTFKSDNTPSFRRLDFDPDYTCTDENIQEKCPTFCEILMRIPENSEAFVARIGSMWHENYSKMQALWLWGEPSAGKSLIMDIISFLYGGESAMAVAYAEDFKDPHMMEDLIGKSILHMPEADPRFLLDRKFKTITGDRSQPINPKLRKKYTANIDATLWFTSNDKPLVPKDEAIYRRLIVCKILPFEGKKLHREQIMNMIKPELAAFVGYCINTYKEISTEEGYIKCTRGGLEEATEEYNSTAKMVFDKTFMIEFSENNYLTPSDFNAAIRLATMEYKVSAKDIRSYATSVGCVTVPRRVGPNKQSRDVIVNIKKKYL